MTTPTDAWLDRNGLRWYTFKGKDYISVTSMRQTLGMPPHLHQWSQNQLVKAIQNDPTLVKAIGNETQADVLRKAMLAADEERDNAARRGTAVHEAIAEGRTLPDVAPELRPYIQQYAQAVIALGIKPLLVERQIFNDTYGYAGSFDMLAHVKQRDNKVYIIDLKTGKSTHPEAALQVLSYLKGEFIGKGDKVDDNATAVLKSATGIGVLHIRPRSWHFHDIDPSKGLEQAWRATAVLANWFTRFKSIESLEVR